MNFPILFLDVDGVLNNSSTLNKTPEGWTGVDDINISNLHTIIELVPDIKIVLSSDWSELWWGLGIKAEDNSISEDAVYLKRRLKEFGIKIYDILHRHSRPERGLAIREFLKGYPQHSFVILDDDLFDYYEENLNEHLVHTDKDIGLSTKDVVKTIDIIKDNTVESDFWEINEKRWGDREVRCHSCGAILEGNNLEWRNNYYCYHCGKKKDLSVIVEN